jgi:hypothetical protein
MQSDVMDGWPAFVPVAVTPLWQDEHLGVGVDEGGHEA